MNFDRREFVTAAGGLAIATAADLAGISAASAATNDAVPDKLDIRYAFSIAVFFNERIMIESPRMRGFVPAAGGEVWGPRLQGKVIPYGGADYQSRGLHAYYQLQAGDGAMIYIQNRGYVRRIDGRQLQFTPPKKPGEKIDQVVRSAVDPDAPTLFRITPTFDAPVGPHDWLTRTVFIGHGRRYVNPDHTIFTYYEVL